MGSKKAKPVDIYRVNADAAATAAAVASPQEAKVNEYESKLWDIYTGKESFDLSKLPNANVMMSLYNGAKDKSDRGRVGKGLAYGGEGYNPNLIASIDEQNQNEREIEAQGALEGRVADTFSGIEGKMLGLAQSDQSRRDNNFNRTFSIYDREAQAQAQRDAKPKWWENLLTGAAGAATTYASGGLSSLMKRGGTGVPVSGTPSSAGYA